MTSSSIVIDRGATRVENGWTTLQPDAPLPAQGRVVVPLVRLLAETPAVLALEGGIGVLIGPDEHVEPILPWLSKLELVAIGFPKFRDGRGFTHIRALCEHFGWQGEIRACGHVLPDQFLSLVRLGVSTIELPDRENPAIWAEVLALRGGLDGRPAAEQPLPLLRRLAAQFDA